jgi:ABC-type transport system involved in Fe-S cluster assembly fused permease/ATPase subunit
MQCCFSQTELTRIKYNLDFSLYPLQWLINLISSINLIHIDQFSRKSLQIQVRATAMLQVELAPTLLKLVLPILLLVPFLFGSFAFRKAAVHEKWRQSYRDFMVFTSYLVPLNKKETRQSALLVTGALLLLAVERLLNLVIPLVLRNAVDTLATPDCRFPWRAILTFIILQHVLLKFVSNFARMAARTFEHDLRDRIQCVAYDKLLSLSAEYHDSQSAPAGWHFVLIGGDKVSNFLRQVCFDIIPSLLDIALGVSAFWTICGGYVAASVTVYLATYVLAIAMFGSNSKSEAEQFIKHRMNVAGIAHDTTQNWWTVQSFNRIAYEKARFRDAVDIMRANTALYNISRLTSKAITHIVMVAGLTIVAVMISYQIRFGGRSVGDFVMLLQFWGGLTSPIARILAGIDRMDDFFIESKKLLEILRHEPAIQDREGAVDYEFRGGSISFENVDFSYDGKRQILNDISFKVEAGQTVAIVGETGGGKSTLLKLLYRAYDVSSGSIKVDDQDVRDVRLESLLEQISIVPQTIGVFNTSILTNLKYSKLDATRKDCEEACHGAALHKKISLLPKGYDEAVGTRGMKLSGGELQRFAIARVLLRDSKIVLFDEAMSSLDSETESRIQSHLRKWCAGRTVIIIAHRLATISHTDLILAVKDGRIVEAGRQTELLAKKGYYYELWDKQRLA